ncbi:MAG TPA: type II toxin-antitoxin system RelB/DinJ family antitoxin [Candidatus Dormibacteraeota bacterium]|nr:type II toxin-antitoxin system RelB/DinJ family antitoxin [Candidatus Dormibacteraeota bacterium]
MTKIFRVRLDPKLLKQAQKVAEQMGTSPGEIVRLCFTQMVKRRALPFSVSADASDGLLDKEHRNRILRSLDDPKGW